MRKSLAESSLTDMTSVPAGTFQMGNQKFTGGTEKVTVKAFYISKYNVSWKKYDLYSEAAGRTKLQKNAIGIFIRDENHPVGEITWYQANDYCQYLEKITGLPYDLPTAIQWEYVARNNGRANWNFPTNNGKQELGENFPNMKNFTSQKGNDSGEPAALPIGSIPCTPQGVCGLSGAVNEWTKTRSGNKRIIRGADADGSPEFANVYDGTPIDPNKQWAGFRCVINSDKSMAELKAIAEKHLP